MYDVWRAIFGINLQSTFDMGQNGSELTEFGRNFLNFETEVCRIVRCRWPDKELSQPWREGEDEDADGARVR